MSDVMRQIVREFMDGPDHDTTKKTGVYPGKSTLAGTSRGAKSYQRHSRQKKWVTQEVKLRRDQYEFLARLSDELGISVSRVTRRIVMQTIDTP